PTELVSAKQVHGTEVLFVKTREPMDYVGFDIIMTDQKGIPIGVRTADCVPLLMVEPEKKIIAAVHAGWKGSAAGVAKKAIQEICDRGGKAKNIVVSVGPCVSGRCYEVGNEVAVLIRKNEPELWSSVLKEKPESKWLLDLREFNRLQLIQAGVLPERIDQVDLCTHCRSDLLHSYRRDRSKAGRMVNFIQIV
ncbi:MAG: peptidoglycan editing factor PgeF, partial [Deltaproteobacteria bacterium]|nr:peptidoglycan editing factor PgeF [Deltaproteobacteria bacterium]